METREYFEKVMQDYNQNRKGRSLRKYCKDEAVDYDWLIEFKKSYRSNQLQPNENKKSGVIHQYSLRWVEWKILSLQPF